MTVRTRFAPSPTGQVHIGNIRVALYNWLFARHAGGQFLLRIEDTDRERSTPEACRAVFEAMEWLGLDTDEAPLYQSSRMQAHLDAAEQLLASGQAYREDKGGTGQGECVIFRMPGEDMAFDDAVKGPLSKAADDMKDFVIVRSNGTPVFHLANVVDDIHMELTHVIRGDDHVENTFRHIALYRAFGAAPPTFAHLPMIVNAQGKPYSKRDGDAYVGDFREAGFLPDALINYLALLGWSPGDDREILSREDMVQLFSLDRVQSKPAQFDLRKLAWMNGEYVRALPIEERLKGCRKALEAAGLWREDIDPDYFGRVIALLGDRIRLFSDVPEQAVYFFSDDFPYNEKAVRKRLNKEGVPELLETARARFADIEPFTAEVIEEAVRELAETRGISAGKFIHPIRVAVSGSMAGPGLFDLLALLGKDRVLDRLKKGSVI